MDNSTPITIGIVAGEASGDQLGAGLIFALRKRFPNARFEGVGGEKMIAEGFHSLYPMERLSVMGIVEPLKRLPELLRMRSNLYKHFRDSKPALFIGIDSPDFTIHLEGKLRRAGVTTAHYVSPSVWAWRQGRVKTIARSVDHILTLFPFESRFYQQHGVPETCVGHPLADKLPMENDTAAAREQLGLSGGKPLLALLPGSRGSEVAQLGTLFLQVAQKLEQQVEGIRFVIPAANPHRRQQIDELVKQFPNLDITVTDGNALLAMAAADALLVASGTVTLEAMLLKKPMVVSYRMGKGSYAIFSRLVKVPHVALPNLLADQRLVPELIQDDATVDNISEELLNYLNNPERTQQLVDEFTQLHQLLRRKASETAADSLSKLIERSRVG
ncbi:lipid-A-disaccharide synthase [Porticoccus sp. W117]|uniref:lipid-A-disaccharide synthase n=1 Tax=Porticoccus sp. W117 TaxID=3054777 RepID=UPI00259198EE|nr:lipid-A-disaccharide synthase [Porticoccus sp. W117]MDM3870275.1 lipid-A-disaccharide synthase [Porticoccus sp. W117]